VIAHADDRKMGETGAVAETLADQLAKIIKLRWGDTHRGMTAFAIEILALTFAHESVEAGTMAEVHMAHNAGALESLEVAVDRSGVEGEASIPAFGWGAPG
jgi:hypothetical protein